VLTRPRAIGYVSLLALIAVTGVGARPALAQYRIESRTTEHGLPQNSVGGIIQTRDGFLWLTTFGGLVRYDGATLQVYNTVNTRGLRTSRFTNLFEDREGALWAATDGQGVTRYQDGAFVTYTSADGLADNRVLSVFNDAGGRLLVDTLRGLVEWRDGRFAPYAGPVPSVSDPDKRLLGRGIDGAMWYTDAAGLHKFDGKRVTQHVPILSDPHRVYEDRRGRLWMETRERTIAQYDHGRLTTYGAADGIPTFGTASMFEDRQGHMWFGLRGGGGLLRFDGTRFTRYTTADGLPNDNVGLVFEDREGTLWVPTDGGLARLTHRAIHTYAAADGLPFDNTYPVFRSRNGDILAGGWQGLGRYRDGAFTSVGQDFGVAGENVMSIAEDHEGATWVGTWGGGARRVKDGRITAYHGDDGAPGDVVRVIYESRGADLWFGSSTRLSRFRDGVFTPFGAAEGYAGGEVYVLREDRAGTLWIGGENGLSRYRDGVFTHFGEKEGLTGYAVRAIHEDQEGTLWLGTYDSGLFRFRDGRFTRYTTREGLFTNGAFHIIEDERGHFWISSNLGIYRVARRELEDVAEGRLPKVTSVPYGRRDGMLNAECNGGGQPAGLRTPDGRIWFPTQHGVAVFDPGAIPVNKEPPPVVITDLLVANAPVDSRERVAIRSGPTAVEVHYAALTFVQPELARFRYRMEGLDTDWVDAGSQRTARFAQLPYGSFRFRVIAANRDGVWNEEGASVDILVVRPFWRTSWFLALGILTVAAAGLAGHNWRMGLLQHQRDVREAFSRQLIASQENERRRIAAGLHDGLSQSLIVIKNWALLGQRTLHENPETRARLIEIEGTALEALDEVREVVHHLAPYQLERLGLVRAVGDMVARVSASSGIRFDFAAMPLEAELSSDAQVGLFRILQEALNNIVKHSAATDAFIDIQMRDGAVVVTVIDNGRGFAVPAADTPGSARGGFGLFGMSERIRMLGGHLEIDARPGRGTTITLHLPVAEPFRG
jgi:signal transduction histidine kinase/ligand-binding sensor domain-containing protein